MAATFATGGVATPGSSAVLMHAGETVAPCRLAERQAIEHLIHRSQRSNPVRADVLVDQQRPNLLQLAAGPLLRRLRHTKQSHQQRRHPGDGTQ